MKIIAFPEYNEVNLLLKKYNMVDRNVNKPLIKDAIKAIRQTYGIFHHERHFNTVIQLLAHDWLSSEIPVLLPPPASNYLPLDCDI